MTEREECQRRLQREALRAITYIQEQEDFGPMTKQTLIAMVKAMLRAHDEELA